MHRTAHTPFLAATLPQELPQPSRGGGAMGGAEGFLLSGRTRHEGDSVRPGVEETNTRECSPLGPKAAALQRSGVWIPLDPPEGAHLGSGRAEPLNPPGQRAAARRGKQQVSSRFSSPPGTVREQPEPLSGVCRAPPVTPIGCFCRAHLHKESLKPPWTTIGPANYPPLWRQPAE